MEEMIGQRVVVDLRSEYVCLGTLKKVDADFLELRNADLHDLRDTDTTRENYIAASAATDATNGRTAADSPRKITAKSSRCATHVLLA